MQHPAAELLGGHLLPRRGLHQRRAAEEDRALVADDHGLVAHRRDVGAARRARPHHRRQLRDPLRRHRRLVEEDAAEVLAVGEDLVLHRQVGAARVDQVDAGQPVLQRHLLRPQVLLHRHRVVGAAFDGGVVGDDDDLAPLDPTDPGDDPGPRRGAVVEALGGERRDLEEGAAEVEQPLDPLARQELAALDVTGASLLATAGRDAPEALPQLADEVAMLGLVALVVEPERVDRGRQDATHAAVLLPRSTLP